MAKSQTRQEHVKLPRVPQGARVQKRPLLRPQLSSSSKTPTVYVSSRTPVISAVKRVRKLLAKSLAAAGPASKSISLRARVEALEHSTNTTRTDIAPLAVTVLGTGKAVERVLSVASWFEQEGDCHVRLETTTVTTVDDIVMQGADHVDESRARRVSGLEVIISLK